MNQIRPLAICVFRNKDRILVFEGYDPIKGEIFYRPLGGGIEFGEYGEEAIRREIMEELQTEIKDLSFLGMLENVFIFNGTPGHEIVMVYDGMLIDSRLYDQVVIAVMEAKGEEIRALWMNQDEFGAGKSILYPDGLLTLLGKLG